MYGVANFHFEGKRDIFIRFHSRVICYFSIFSEHTVTEICIARQTVLLNIGPTTLWCGQNMNELRNLSLAGWNPCLFCTTMKSCQLSLKKKHLSQCLLFSFVFFLFFSNESSIHMYATNWRFFFCICKLFTACCTQKMYVDMRLIHVNIQDNHIFTCLSCRYQFLFHMQTPISLICKMQYMFK